MSSWLTARLSLWNIAGFVVIIGTELPHGLVASFCRVVSLSQQSGLSSMCLQAWRSTVCCG